MFVDTNGVIRNRKAKTEKQCNGKKKGTKDNDIQTQCTVRVRRLGVGFIC